MDSSDVFFRFRVMQLVVLAFCQSFDLGECYKLPIDIHVFSRYVDILIALFAYGVGGLSVCCA